MINRKGSFKRLIVITDEQATTGRAPSPVAEKAYMINVASCRNGVGYGAWTHLDGFSEGVLRWMAEFEKLPIKPEVRPLIMKQNAIRLLGLK